MDRRRINQLLGLGRDVISTTVAVLTGHCIIERHAKRKRLAFNNFCRGSKFAEVEETVMHFLFQFPSLSRRRYSLFGSPFIVSLTELSSIDIKGIASYITVLAGQLLSLP